MSVATGTALCLIEFFNDLELCLLMTRNDHLGDTLSRIDDEILLSEINEQRHYFSAIVSIHGSR